MFTVIIPTLGKRPKHLDLCLSSLSRQVFQAFNVIVVNDGSPESSILPVIRKYENVMKVRLVNKKNQSGPAAALNVGLKFAKGDIIATVNDDCVLSNEWLSSLNSRYVNEKIGAVGGPIYFRDEKRTAKTIALSWYGAMRIDRDHVKHPVEAKILRGISSYKRHLLDKVGGFDIRLGLYSIGEDFDVSLSIRELGYTLVFDPDAWVIHYDLPLGGCKPITGGRQDWLKRHYWLVRNRIYVLLKHEKFPIKKIPSTVVISGYLFLKLARARTRLPKQYKFSMKMAVPYTILGVIDGVASLMSCGLIRYYGR